MSDLKVTINYVKLAQYIKMSKYYISLVEKELDKAGITAEQEELEKYLNETKIKLDGGY